VLTQRRQARPPARRQARHAAPTAAQRRRGMFYADAPPVPPRSPPALPPTYRARRLHAPRKRAFAEAPRCKKVCGVHAGRGK